MQTSIAVHDIDQEQGHVMNNNAHHGSNPNRKEKQMNAISKTTFVAMLVALGLLLGAGAARAAEPPKPEAPEEVYVSDLPWTSSTSVVRKNMAPSGSKDIPIKIGTVTYAKGIWTVSDRPIPNRQAPSMPCIPLRGCESSVVVDITGKGYRSFRADVGAASRFPGNFGTTFLVLVDGIVKARTRPIGNVPVKVSADVTNGRTLTLTAISDGCKESHWEIWGDAMLSTAPPATVPSPGMGPADQSWDLKTGSTHLTVGRQGDRVGIYSLKHVGSVHNWMDSPSEIPLMAKVETNRVAHALKWVFKDATVDDRQGTKVTLRFVNAAPPLTLESEWWARPGPGPVRTAMTIRNDSKEPVTVFYQPSLRLPATGDGPTASWCIPIAGVIPDPVGLYRDPLVANEFRYLKCGLGNYNWIPFLGLDVGDTHGMYVGIEWSAGWIYREDVSVTTTLVEANGYGDGEAFSYAVPVGGTFAVPPAFVGAYKGDLDDAGNDLKKYLWNYSMPEILRTDETYPKVQWNGFTALGDKAGSWTTLQSRWKPWIDAIAPLGFEEAMHDVGWWGGKHGYPDPVRWPQGMKVAGDYAKSKGLRFGLYLQSFDYSAIKHLFDDYGADIWRNDMIDPGQYYEGVRKVYDTLDRLQKDVPNFQYENCSSGGNIKDFGIMKRAVKIYNAESAYHTGYQEPIFWASSHLFPPIQLEGSVGARVATGVAGLVYTFRSAASGAPDWFLDTPDGGWGDKAWTQEEKDAIRTVVAMYKAKVRPLQRNSNLYHLTRPDGKEWYTFQYYKPEEKKGVVYVFKRPGDTQVIKLKRLDPAATYAVTFADNSNPPVTRTGAELMNAGIQVTLKGQVVSEWIFLN